MRLSMRDKPKDTILREDKIMQEFNLFDRRTNIHRNITGERLSEFFYSLSLSSPSADYLNLLRACLLQPPRI